MIQLPKINYNRYSISQIFILPLKRIFLEYKMEWLIAVHTTMNHSYDLNFEIHYCGDFESREANRKKSILHTEAFTRAT